jgi:hypothetical protein
MSALRIRAKPPTPGRRRGLDGIVGSPCGSSTMSETRLASLGLAARHRPGYSWRSSEPTASPTTSRAGTTATTLGHVCGCDDWGRPREVPEEGAPEQQVEPYGERQHGQSECRAGPRLGMPDDPGNVGRDRADYGDVEVGGFSRLMTGSVSLTHPARW